MNKSFHALVVNKIEQSFSRRIESLTLNDLPEAGVLIRVCYSGINYKDSLAAIPNGHILKNYPFVPGIDLSGIVVSSEDPRFKKDDPVIVTGYSLGVSHFGGFSEYARIPADWIVPLPSGLTLKEAMRIGTAGFTAALSVFRLEQAGIAPDKGEVIVTGASGGVGSHAVALLSDLGYSVVASSGKSAEASSYLKMLGAQSVIAREAVFDGTVKPLQKQQWTAAVDSVGGKPLAGLLGRMRYGGYVAACGLAAGSELPATVFPFILRGVNLLGIDSVSCPMELRQVIWQRLAELHKPKKLAAIAQKEIPLSQLPNALPALLSGKKIGRTIVILNPEVTDE
ncbi:oxidoreductase [Sporolactobacillus terrae]|uniref:Putative quinone oxidoreductase YhfP n=1 Tax=Sporolactobacillus terrae TaxID=269673 RepID=A0A5K7X766_9BACL|nr:oxidoreductase [Sporolactobacillus terrae]BBO00384.1 putative quinone oxidoreductase YhfP [Sporolactobacillus terrae]